MACLGSSDFLINAVLNATTRGQSFSGPATLYVALATGSVVSSNTGSTLPEVAGGSYARQAITCNTSNWTNPGAGVDQVTNLSSVTFPTATASWGTVTNFALCDASGAGNLIFYGALTASQSVSTGNQVTIAASGLTVSMT